MFLFLVTYVGLVVGINSKRCLRDGFLLLWKRSKVSGTTVVTEETQSLFLDKVFLRNYFL